MNQQSAHDPFPLLVKRIRNIRRAAAPIDAAAVRDLVFGGLILNVMARRMRICSDSSVADAVDTIHEIIGFELPSLSRLVQCAQACESGLFAVVRAELDDVGSLCVDDPLLIGWCYQLWNAPQRDQNSWGVSRKGDDSCVTDSLAAATQIFTEEYMVECLVNRALALHAPRALGDFELCDPACGVGHFLVGAVRGVVARMNPGEVERLLPQFLATGLYGFDIDPVAVDLCQAIVLLESLRYLPRVSTTTWLTLCTHIIVVEEPYGTLRRDSNKPLLNRTYRCIATNPPYLGRRKVPDEMRRFLDCEYPDGALDLCAAFMQRCVELTDGDGTLLLVTIDKWLRLKGYRALRSGGRHFCGLYNLLSFDLLCEVGSNAFRPQLELHSGVGIVVTAAVKRTPDAQHRLQYLQLRDLPAREERQTALRQAGCVLSDAKGLHIVAQERLRGEDAANLFAEAAGIPTSFLEHSQRVDTVAAVVVGLQTNDDGRFVRYFWEVAPDRERWKVHSRGGGYGRWCGCNRWVLDWGEGRAAFARPSKAGLTVETYIGKEGWTYTWFANGCLGLRVKPEGWSFGRAAASGFFTDDLRVVGVLNARIGSLTARSIGGKVQLPEGVVRALPLPRDRDGVSTKLVTWAAELAMIITQHEPTDIFFGSRQLLPPLEVLAIETLLLLIEGLLEEQVMRSIGCSAREREGIDKKLAPPVGMGAPMRISSWSTLRRCLPEAQRGVLDCVHTMHVEAFPIEGAHGEGVRDDDLVGVEFLQQTPVFRAHNALPAVMRTERLARERGIHPLDLFHLLAVSWDQSPALRYALQATGLRNMILFQVLKLFSHQYWYSSSDGAQNVCAELAISDVAEGVQRGWVSSHGDVISLQELDETLGVELSAWLGTQFATWHSKAFFGVPLIIHDRHSRFDAGVFRHRWGCDSTPLSRI